jgi:hypothetical protein
LMFLLVLKVSGSCDQDKTDPNSSAMHQTGQGTDNRQKKLKLGSLMVNIYTNTMEPKLIIHFLGKLPIE